MSTELETSNPQPKANAADQATRWLDGLITATVLAACLVAMSNAQAEPDLWGHVQYARDAMRDGLPRNSTYTYTAEDCRWINHELLSEHAFAWGFDRLGTSGLLALKLALGLLVLLLIVRRAKAVGATQFATFFVAILFAANMAFFWMLRPQLFSFVFFALLLSLLNWCFAGWEGKWQLITPRRAGAAAAEDDLSYSPRRMRALWLTPILFCLWANTHGAFLAGICIFIAYLSCRGLEAVLRRGRAAIGLLKRFALMIAVSILATFLNPYGARLHVWLVESLLPPRPEIIEWLPPQITWEVTSLAWLPFWILLAVSIAALVVNRRSIDFTHLTILLLLTWQAVEHRRHIALVAITFAFWLPKLVSDLLRSLKFGQDGETFASDLPPRARWLVASVGVVLLAGIGLLLADQCEGVVVHKDQYPVSAFEYLADQQFSGKMVVNFDWAQYAIMAFGAPTADEFGLRFQFDGRYDTCYPREVVDMHFDFEIGEPHPGSRYRAPTSPQLDGRRVLDFNQPDLLLLHRRKSHPQQILASRHGDWVLLYQDSLAQLWGRASKYDDPAGPEYVPLTQRRISDEPQTGTVSWPAIPTPGHSVAAAKRFASQVLLGRSLGAAKNSAFDPQP